MDDPSTQRRKSLAPKKPRVNLDLNRLHFSEDVDVSMTSTVADTEREDEGDESMAGGETSFGTSCPYPRVQRSFVLIFPIPSSFRHLTA